MQRSLFTFALLALASACGSSDGQPDGRIVGTWVEEKCTQNVSPSRLQAFGTRGSTTFTADGKVSMGITTYEKADCSGVAKTETIADQGTPKEMTYTSVKHDDDAVVSIQFVAPANPPDAYPIEETMIAHFQSDSRATVSFTEVRIMKDGNVVSMPFPNSTNATYTILRK